MSDARLWDATKEPTVSSSQRSHVASRGGPSSVQSYDVSQATNIETKVWRDSEARTSLTDEYTGDSNAVASGASGSGVQITRKTSEQRTAATEEYVGDSNSKVEPNVGMNVLGCKIGQNLNAEGLLLHREGAGERTSLTEEYAGDVSPNTSNSTTALCVRRKDNVFKDGFIESSPLPKSQGQSPDGRISTRTALVNDYAGAKLNGSSSNPLLFTRPGGGISAIPSALEGSTPFPELHDGRRTSSLDGYIGNPSVVSNDSSDSARVHSDSSLDDNKRFQRTSLVDQYFQEVSRSLDAERFGTPYQPSPFSRVSFQGPMDSHSRGDADEMSWSSEREMTRSSLDSWMSHTGPVPLQSHMLLEAEDQADVSLLSHTSFPSWASHPCIPASTNPGGRVLIPVAVEEINKNAKTWK